MTTCILRNQIAHVPTDAPKGDRIAQDRVAAGWKSANHDEPVAIKQAIENGGQPLCKARKNKILLCNVGHGLARCHRSVRCGLDLCNFIFRQMIDPLLGLLTEVDTFPCRRAIDEGTSKRKYHAIVHCGTPLIQSLPNRAKTTRRWAATRSQHQHVIFEMIPFHLTVCVFVSGRTATTPGARTVTPCTIVYFHQSNRHRRFNKEVQQRLTVH